MIIGIVCVDRNWGIGKKNNLLFHLPKDMKFFRETTNNSIVAMGYNTLLSFPGGKPLKNRLNLVLAPVGIEREDCVVVHSFEEMLDLINKYSAQGNKAVYIIGGAMFYKSMLPYFDEVYVNKVDADGNAEVFFTNLDNETNFKVISANETVIDNGYYTKLYLYKRIN